ncbi:membrane protein [Desulfuromonas versatilis]|uniref:Membrane protein n=1 Tax=Desulfuromonas versatilis TaxID=2802975 RepID=A0ABN6DT61_9BACT|nr:transglutaminaseTgpA domain-containing protein [Desulfuromonas versatilis]BCR03343.1 membrane protein [Desulfuromonas versatilis]
MVKISTLLYLLANAACLLGAAPLFPHLDLPVQLALGTAVPLGMVLDRRGRRPLPGPWGTLVALALFGVYAIQISMANLVQPVVNILALMLTVRLLSEKSNRNILQLFVLALFALASSSLLSLSAAFFVYLVLLVAVVTIGLVLLSFHVTDPALVLDARTLRRLLSVAGLLPAISLVLMVVFFVILPRTQRPLWNFLNPPEAATVGFSDKVEPGAYASTASAKTVALRVESQPLAPEDLYWRAIVLNRLEGNTWSRAPEPEGERTLIQGGRQVTQVIYPEPKSDPYLVALDAPRSLEGMRAQGSGDLVFTTRRSIDRRARVAAVSVVGGTSRIQGPADRAFYLQTPQEVAPRVAALGEELRAGGDALRKIASLQEFFRGQGLTYATSDLPRAADPIDDFLFGKKRGYCEFFASSFALVLRLAGVPARLVGGYYGGDYNELGGYYLVTEDRAHVWVEALTEEGIWLRLDPSSLASNAASALLAQRNRGLNTLQRLADALNYFWNQAVIAYDLGRQFELLRSTGLRMKHLQVSLDWRLAAGLGLAILGLALGGRLLWRRARSSTETRLLQRFLRQAARAHGLAKIPCGEGLYELAERLDDERCRSFARIYGGALYRDRRLTDGERRRLTELIEELKRSSGGG